MSSDVLALGGYSTPCEEFRDLGLWVKHERGSMLYGGNKLRKLEHLLGAARAEGKHRILTLGAAGSHQVIAAALHGKREGFHVEAVLVPQPSSEHARRNLRIALAHGLVPIVSPSWAAAPAIVAAHLRRDTYFIPLGGSNARGSLGFLDAAKEIAVEVEAGSMPEPDAVVVALGSGGTAAGLAVGFEALGMRTRVVAVPISPPARVLGAMARRLAKATAELAGLSRRQSVSAVKRIDVDRRWVGRGYGHPTPEGMVATELAQKRGMILDGTYTAKAFACALGHKRETPSDTILYWHTLSTTLLEPLLAGASELPASVECLFR
ncbi:MAG TPA: pyridoxal-phosphate dependent enzyme [Labilithrix sp.]|nr:pyridoxal-phosphate dependent enzyme [Labilithrix sp.]